MKNIYIKGNYIKLGQFIKFINLVSNGSDVKEFLLNNNIFVNGILEQKRGRKLFINDKVKILDSLYIILGYQGSN